MATDVVMPQMGESITEGTIVRWMKKVGDKVDRDEPLFEISTDKVDAEIPSPAAGVVAEIRAKAGETVAVNSVVAVIGSSEVVIFAPPASEEADVPAGAQKPVPAPQEAVHARSHAAQSSETLMRERSSPLVRKIAREHHVDISQIQGSGIAGRVTKHDIMGYLGREGREGQEEESGRDGHEGRDSPVEEVEEVGQVGHGDRVEQMSVMRKKIAEHMVQSRRTSAHVHSVFDVNFSRVAQIREARRAEYERAGGKLTYLAFIIKAVVDALQAVPVVNASINGDTVVYHNAINIGIAVALDWGLIVPVIKDAGGRTLLDLSRSVADLASRARGKQLKPDDVSGGTFTITNPGVFGASFGMPIINQPQVAILAVGAIEKRPAVVGDAIAVQTMAYLSLGFDHRIIDGAVADGFMSHVKHALEHWDPEQA
jgi:pyruvate dehydrogenase E2 component (dihydrolipoamide acetyltransferase)